MEVFLISNNDCLFKVSDMYKIGFLVIEITNKLFILINFLSFEKEIYYVTAPIIDIFNIKFEKISNITIIIIIFF